MADKKNFDFKIYSPEDLSKKWFVFWIDERGKRVRKYGTINHYDTFNERMQAAKALGKSFLCDHIPSLLYEYLEKNRLRWRKKTHQTYLSKVNKFVEWIGRRVITHELVGEFFHHLLCHKSKGTYNDYLVTLTRCFKGIYHDHLIEGIQKVKNYPTPAKYFQSYQVKRLKKRIKEEDPDLWFFVEFIYYCFIRPGTELRLLKVGDIHLDDRTIRIRGDISKNSKTEYITIPTAFFPRIEHLSERNPNEYIFQDKRDLSKPLGMNNMSNRHRIILRDMGFSREHVLYSWKHTGAVNYMKTGGNVKELQIQLRHHSLDQVDQYLRQLGVHDIEHLRDNFPAI